MTDPISGELGALVHSGWIAVAPDTAKDAAFWLIATPSEQARATMPAVAAVLGLPATPGSVDWSTAQVLIGADGWATLDVGADSYSRPVSREWAQVAQNAGRVILMVGYEPMPAGVDVDQYTDRLMHSGRFSIGLARLREQPT
jgi:hypothetical protein